MTQLLIITFAAAAIIILRYGVKKRLDQESEARKQQFERKIHG